MKTIFAALALGLAAPALAAQPAAATDSAPDSAHVAAADRVIALMMPPGAIQRLFLDEAEMQNSVVEAIGGIGDDGGPDGDPHFAERMRITNDVTNRVLGEVMGEMEPEFRATFARMFARRFSVAELGEMEVFFSTPTGRKYAEMTFTIGRDPALQELALALVPRMLEAAPRIDERVRAATAHLPPPPPPVEEWEPEE